MLAAEPTTGPTVSGVWIAATAWTELGRATVVGVLLLLPLEAGDGLVLLPVTVVEVTLASPPAAASATENTTSSDRSTRRVWSLVLHTSCLTVLEAPHRGHLLVELRHRPAEGVEA